MKVIQVCPTYYPQVSGSAYHVKQISEGIAKKNIEVYVYTTDCQRIYRHEENINGVKVKRLFSLAPENSYFFPPSLLRLLKKAKVDIIHAHVIHALPLLIAALAKNSNNVPLVSTFNFHGRGHTLFRNLLFQPYKRLLGEYILKKTDLLICMSEHEKRMIDGNFRMHVKTVVIPAGLRFDPPANIPPRKNLGKKKITFVGRLEAYKGVQYLLYAFSRLVKEVDAQLTVIGDGPYEPKLKSIAIKLNISDKVFFPKRRGNEIIPEYCTSDVVVIPSQYESFNMVAIEALACGAPVITTPVGEGYTLTKEGKCIPLSNPTNIHELYQKIKTVLEKRQNEPKESFHQEILSRYSYERIVELTLNEYEKLWKR